MSLTISIFSRLLDVIAPRQCPVCHRRLSVTEQLICASCNRHLPRTDHALDFHDNELSRLFWGRFPIERAFALVRHEPKSEMANIVYRLKYGRFASTGIKMGEFIAKELRDTDFFEGITAIVPVPLTKKRQRQRGFNQSLQLARGLSAITGIPVLQNCVSRSSFAGSQTTLNRLERAENVKEAFQLTDVAALTGQHVLIVDDVVTTGATMTSLAQQLLQAKEVKISVLSWGRTSF